MQTNEFTKTVNRMTNYQRNQWARHGYPGQHNQDVEKLYAFVPRPVVEVTKKKRIPRKKKLEVIDQ